MATPDKPVYSENEFLCQHCLCNDTVALHHGDIGVIWCACGKVYAANGETIKLVHDFDESSKPYTIDKRGL